MVHEVQYNSISMITVHRSQCSLPSGNSDAYALRQGTNRERVQGSKDQLQGHELLCIGIVVGKNGGRSPRLNFCIGCNFPFLSSFVT